jgi:imidazolonepropionase-like amidohydrolase
MKHSIRIAVATALVAVAPAAAHAATILHCGRLIDVREGRVLNNASIVVDGANILRVDQGFTAAAAGDQVVDLRSQTCMPGLIDMHVHLTDEYSAQSDIEGFRLNPADFAIRGVAFAERTLLAGFTAVRDLGGDANVNIALRNGINRGVVKGPRVFTAGRSIATTGGHADPTNGMRMDLAPHPTPEDGVVNGLDDAKRAVRQRYKDGADVIKITATGGVLSVAASGQNPQFTEEEIRAIVAIAADNGFKVAAHAHGADGLKRAVRAGVHSIEHGTYLDDEGIALMKQHGTYLVPTISAGRWVADKAKIDGFFPEVVRGKAAAIGPLIQATFTRAFKAGVKIAFGTDSGVSAHGDNGKEFAYMVEGGMAPMGAIRSATLDAATLLGQTERIGSIEPGKFADIVAVPGDPIANITMMERVSFVMKNGVVYKGPNK